LTGGGKIDMTMKASETTHPAFLKIFFVFAVFLTIIFSFKETDWLVMTP